MLTTKSENVAPAKGLTFLHQHGGDPNTHAVDYFIEIDDENQSSYKPVAVSFVPIKNNAFASYESDIKVVKRIDTDDAICMYPIPSDALEQDVLVLALFNQSFEESLLRGSVRKWLNDNEYNSDKLSESLLRG